MNDMKSKIPDLAELGNMAGKLFKDVKKSVCEIIDTYKAKRNTKEAPHTQKHRAEPHKKEDE